MVLGGTASVKALLRELESGTPGCLTESEGTGGGGINSESVRTLGILEVCSLWALLRAGNAGGESWSRSVSVSSPSSSEAGGEISSTVGTDNGGSGAVVPLKSQSRR